MGRITIFTEDECPDCDFLKSAFHELSLPYNEISLNKYPSKRADMVSLSNDFRVPQVFFNDEHIGGVQETLDTLCVWEKEAAFAGYDTILQRLEIEVLQDEDSPSDHRLMVPIQTNSHLVSSSSLSSLSPSFSLLHSGTKKTMDKVTTKRATKTMKCDDIDDKTTTNGINIIGKIVLPCGSSVSAVKFTKDLMTFMPRSHLLLGRKYHRHCFNGQQAINTWMKVYNMDSRVKALNFGQYLLENGILHPINNRKNNNKNNNNDDKPSFMDGIHDRYRLQSLENPNVLNTLLKWNQEKMLSSSSSSSSSVKIPDPMDIIRKLNTRLDTIIASHTHPKTGRVNYVRASQSHAYEEFEGECGILQLVPWTSILEIDDKDTNNEDGNSSNSNSNNERVAFCINLYNVMIKHYMIRRDITKMTQSSFCQIKYNVGGFILSLDDIHHGILRNNGKKYRARKKQFSKSFKHNGQRKSLLLLRKPSSSISCQRDYRIHFALNCGTKNSPSSSCYSAEALNEELDIAAKEFCAKDCNVLLNETRNELILSQWIQWYQGDFVFVKKKDNNNNNDDDNNGNHNIMDLPQLLLQHLEGEKRQMLERMMMDDTKRLRIKFMKFDWTTNSTNTNRITTSSSSSSSSFLVSSSFLSCTSAVAAVGAVSSGTFSQERSEDSARVPLLKKKQKQQQKQTKNKKKNDHECSYSEFTDTTSISTSVSEYSRDKQSIFHASTNDLGVDEDNDIYDGDEYDDNYGNDDDDDEYESAESWNFHSLSFDSVEENVKWLEALAAN